jgi:hypothetical protein
VSGAGPLRELFAFDQRPLADDGYGNTQSADFVEVFRCAASSTPLRGTEAVIAARLTGIQPTTVVVRYSPQSLRVTTAWRARDTRTGTVFDITAVAPRSRRDYIDITCVSGKAA